MNTKIDTLEIETIFLAAVALMKEHSIALIPENYTLFFAYVSGENTELTKAIDRTMSKGESFAEEYLETLYHQLMGEKENSKLGTIGVELHTVVQTVFNQVTVLHGVTGETSNRVASSIEHLSENSSYNDIFEAVRIISLEAKELGEMSRKMRDELAQMSGELESVRGKLKVANQETRIDHLTSIPNRLAFDEELDLLIPQGDFSLLMIDIDYFKQFNDTYGHLVGDKVLRFVARQISNMVKGNDFAARFGGEEFVVLLPETALEGGLSLAENIRKYFDKTKLKGGSDSKILGKIGISVGVAYHRLGESAEELIERADSALYKAKEGGRNRVERG